MIARLMIAVAVSFLTVGLGGCGKSGVKSTVKPSNFTAKPESNPWSGNSIGGSESGSGAQKNTHSASPPSLPSLSPD